MKYSTKVSDAVHILALIALNNSGTLSSDAMAVSIRTNPGYVRQLMSALRKAGLINCVTGHPHPTLCKDASELTLLDVYRAVEGTKPLLHLDTHTNPDCGVGMNIQYALQDYYDEVQVAAEQAMARITLAMIIERFNEKAYNVPLISL